MAKHISLGAVIAALASVAWAADELRLKKKLVESSSYFQRVDAAKPVWVPPSTRTVDYPTDGVGLGQGWDSLRDVKVQGRCIQFAAEEAGGQVARIQTKRILDSDTLRKSIKLDYSVSAKGGFGRAGAGVGAEGSVKETFVSSSELNTQFVNWLVKGEIQNGVAFISPSNTSGLIELTPFSARLLTKDDGSAEFVKHCGDSYVAAVERGAELYALYQFSSKKKGNTSESSVAVKASANYMGFSGDASTSSASTREAVANNELSGLKYLHTAHRGLRLPFDDASIGDALASLGSAPEPGEAHPYRIKLMRYDMLPIWKHEKLRSGPATREVLVAFHYRLSDLRATAIDIERNPTKYNLKRDADMIASGTLRTVLEKRIAEVASLLAACEEQRDSLDPEERRKVIDTCSTQEEDLSFSDYPYRTLMPIEKAQEILTSPFMQQKQFLEADIAKLQNTLANFRFPAFGGSCADNPQNQICRALRDALDGSRRALAALIADREAKDLAESRYVYWIQAIERSREDDGLINGDLTRGELAMFRREIYCQYGTSPDSAGCPTVALSKLVQEGQVVRKTLSMKVEVSGGSDLSASSAWNSLQQRITTRVAAHVGDKPHHFELIDPVYTTAEKPGNLAGVTVSFKIFSVVANVDVTFFDNDTALVQRVLALP